MIYASPVLRKYVGVLSGEFDASKTDSNAILPFVCRAADLTFSAVHAVPPESRPTIRKVECIAELSKLD